MAEKDLYTFKTRERTLCIDIQSAHPEGRATWNEWSQFLLNDLEVDPLEVKEVGMHSLTRLLMVQTYNDNEYQKQLEKMQAGVHWAEFSVTVYGWSFQENMTTVKLLNVTLSMNLDLLKAKIGEYGTIVSWKLGKHPMFKNSFDNTITVKLMMKHGVKLPAFLPSVSIGEVVHLVSDSIRKACIRCLESGHIAPHCKKPSRRFNKPNKVWSPLPETTTPSAPSYADITEGRNEEEATTFLKSIITHAGIEEREQDKTETMDDNSDEIPAENDQLKEGKRVGEALIQTNKEKNPRTAQPDTHQILETLNEKKERVKSRLNKKTRTNSESTTENMAGSTPPRRQHKLSFSNQDDLQ